MRTRLFAIGWILWFGLTSPSAANGLWEGRREFSIEPMPIAQALQEFSTQADMRFLLLWTQATEGLRSTRVRGRYTPEAALRMLLNGTGLEYKLVQRYIWVRPMHQPVAVISAPAPAPQVPEITVMGIRTSNSEIDYRDYDDTDSVTFRREQLERSTHLTVGEFLRSNLTAEVLSMRQRRPYTINGHSTPQRLPRVPGLASDLDELPLAAVERIEVLTGSRAAAMSVNAPLGTVNMVTRDRKPGTQINLDYGNTFARTSEEHGVYFSRTREQDGGPYWSLSVALWDTPSYLADNGRFLEEGRRRIASNNPSSRAFAPPPLSVLTNVRTVDGSPLLPDNGASFMSLPRGYHSTDGLAPLLNSAGHYDLSLANSAQLEGRFSALEEGTSHRYFSAEMRNSIAQGVTGYVEASVAEGSGHARFNVADYLGLTGARISADAPNNPFGKDVLVTVPATSSDELLRTEGRTYRLDTGLQTTLRNHWYLMMDYSRSLSTLKIRRPDVPSVAERVYDGSLDLLRDFSIEPLDLSDVVQRWRTPELTSSASDFILRTGGPVGGVNIWTAFKHRDDQSSGGEGPAYRRSYPLITDDPTPVRQTMDGVSAEVSFPLGFRSTRVNPPPFILELTGEADRYTGGARPASLGAHSWAKLYFAPRRGITFFGGFSTGFQPPTLSQRADARTNVVPFATLADPLRGDETLGSFSLIAGGNPDLKPERVKRRSAGFNLRLPDSPWMASLGYTRTSTRQEILSPDELFFSDPGGYLIGFPWRVTRAPAGDGDPYEVGRVTAIDLRAQNLARRKSSAVDAALQWSTVSTLGLFSLAASASWQTRFDVQSAESLPFQDFVGIGAMAPPRLRMRTQVTFSRAAWTMEYSTRLTSSYPVSRNPTTVADQGGAYVEAQTYHDLLVRYDARSLTPTTSFQLSVRNLFNATPPFDAGSETYVSRYGDEETRSFHLSARMKF